MKISDSLEEFRAREIVSRVKLSCVLDDILGGGLEKGVITQIYGPPGVGKTNVCIVSAVSTARLGGRVVFIDTEGSHSFERLMQVAGDNYRELLERIMFYEAKNFEEQEFIIENLERVLDESFELVILDSAVALYRVIRDEDSVKELNRRLSWQMAKLLEMARKFELAVIITNQVYSANSTIEPVAGDVLKYWSKAIVELRKLGREREAVLRRHRSLPEDLKVRFVISQEGIEGV